MNLTRMLKVSRLEGLSDGIFAIAMTILVLDLRVPLGTALADLPAVLHSSLLIKLLIYAGSFIILGTQWVAMNFQLGLIQRVNRPYLWANIFYLMVVCVIPFSATLVAAYPNSPLSISFYAINLLCTSIGQVGTSQFAHIYKLNTDVYTPAIRAAILKRICVGPIFNCAGIVLAYWNTSIAFAVLVVPTFFYMFPGIVDNIKD